MQKKKLQTEELLKIVRLKHANAAAFQLEANKAKWEADLARQERALMAYREQHKAN